MLFSTYAANNEIVFGRNLVVTESADHSGTPSAGYGYLWVKSDTPSSLIFTDDAGTDTDLTNISGGWADMTEAVWTGGTQSEIADGASAIAFEFNTDNAYSTSGAKLLSLKNNGTEKAYVTKDGYITGSRFALSAYPDNAYISSNVASVQIVGFAGRWSGADNQQTLHLSSEDNGFTATDTVRIGSEYLAFGRSAKITVAPIWSDAAAQTLEISPAYAYPSATTNLTGGALTIIGGAGASSSAGDADGGAVNITGGGGYGTGDGGNIVLAGGAANGSGVQGKIYLDSILQSSISDGASAIAYEFDTDNSLSTSGAKLLSLKNNTNERFYIAKDGNIVSSPVNNDTLASLNLDVSGTTIDAKPAIGVKLPTSGARKGFTISNGSDTFAWASFEFFSGKPGFAFGPGGGTARDVKIYRDAANVLKTDDSFHAALDLILTEQSDHSSTPAAGYGYVWVKNTDPTTLMFTDDGGNDHTVGVSYREIYVDAAAMVPRNTNGAAAATEEYATNDIMQDYYLFDSITEEGVQFKLVMPDKWDRGTIKAKFFWDAATGASASDGVTWGLSAQSLSNDDAIDAAFGASVDTDDTVIAVGDLHIVTSAAVTVSGSPALGDLILFEVTRVVGDTNDDMAEDAKLLGVQIQYLESATEVSSW